MRWTKLGRLYTPTSRHPKLASHAANPVAIRLDGDVFRILYSGRDTENRSSVGMVDIDIRKQRVVHAPDEPLFVHGPPDSFYAAGVSVGCVYEASGQSYVLFMGWQNPPGGHWRGDIGRLRLEAGALTLADDGPLLGASPQDPISLSYPWVVPTREGFTMWYGSTVAWDAGNGEMLHVLNRATSLDGASWACEGQAVPYCLGEAQAFSRPSVRQRRSGEWDMWFSYRGAPGRTYRIGHAVSRDGRDWALDLAQAGVDVSEAGWDSEMTEYPFVFAHAGQTYMLYNGNGYGRSGFGLAVLAEQHP